MTTRGGWNWSFGTESEREAWEVFLARLQEVVRARFAPLESIGFKSCGMQHRWIDDIRDYTVYFRYVKERISVDFQVAAISLYMCVVLFRFAQSATCDLSVRPLSFVNLEATLETAAKDRLEKPKWLGYATLREAGLRSRRTRYRKIATEQTDACVALLAERLMAYGHLVEPQFPRIPGPG
jgi:hypothetical protein